MSVTALELKPLTPDTTLSLGTARSHTMKTATDFRIVNVQSVTLNGRPAKLFTVFEKQGDVFVHVGRFSAAAKTANRDLWKIAAAVGA